MHADYAPSPLPPVCSADLTCNTHLVVVAAPRAISRNIYYQQRNILCGALATLIVHRPHHR